MKKLEYHQFKTEVHSIRMMSKIFEDGEGKTPEIKMHDYWVAIIAKQV